MKFTENPKFIYFFAAISSLLLSLYIDYRESLINPDAICYLQSAAVIGAGGLRKAMNLCPQAQWPLYSVLIYFTSLSTHLSLTVAAYVLDALFSMLSVLMFIGIVQQLSGQALQHKKRILWFAALVILMAHEFNSTRSYIVRDHGFWAFYLSSLFLLVRYVEVLRWPYAFGWGITLVIATLFRIEGIIFLLLFPYVLWFRTSLSYWQRTKSFLQLSFIPLLLGVVVFGWLIFHPEISLASLGRMQDVVFQIFHAGGMIWQRFQASAQGFAHSVLTTDSFSEASMVFFLTILVWYFVKVVINLSLIYSALAAYAVFRQALIWKNSSRFVVLGYLFINLVVTGLFLAEHLFLSKRYLIALSLILMLWVPFALDRLFQQWQERQLKSWMAGVVVVMLCVSAIGGVVRFGYSKDYMRQAGDWLAFHVEANDSLYSNDYQIMYYSKHFDNDIFQKIKEYKQEDVLAEGRWKDYDYLALRVSKKDFSSGHGIVNEITRAPVKIFSNARGDQVRIYKYEH